MLSGKTCIFCFLVVFLQFFYKRIGDRTNTHLGDLKISVLEEAKNLFSNIISLEFTKSRCLLPNSTLLLP